MCAPEYKGTVSVSVGNIGTVTDELLEHIRTTHEKFQPGTFWRQEDGSLSPNPPPTDNTNETKSPQE